MEADIQADKAVATPSSETYGEIDRCWGTTPAYGMPDHCSSARFVKPLNMGYQ